MVKVQKASVQILGKQEKPKKKSKPISSIDNGKQGVKKTKGSNALLEKAPKQIKQKIIQAVAKNEDIVKPVKKEKSKMQKNKMDKPHANKAVNMKATNQSKDNSASAKQKQKQLQKSAAKRPLVLAPPESPAPKSTKVAAITTTQKKKKPFSKKTDPPAKNKIKQQQKNTIALGVNQTDKLLTKSQKKNAKKRAYKKQQQKKKRAGAAKERKTPRKQFEAPPFDEDKFNAIVTEENILKIAMALKKQVEKEVSEKKTGIFSDYHYLLNVSCFQIPSCPKRVVKLNLKHSLVDKEDDVAIVVTDLQRGAKVDYDPTIQHYEDLFREAGIEGLKIVPFNKLRNECTTFETVRKFGNSYDYFLCDGRLVGHVAGFCGKIFQKPRTTFHAVRMDNTNNLKREIEKSLRRTAYRQLNKGDLITIPIGNHKYSEKQVAENAAYVVEQLKTLYPGGLGNMRGLNLKIDITGTSSLPIYMSMAQPPAETPYVVGPREQRLLKLRKDANEVLSNFNLTKEGDILKLSKTEVANKRKLKAMRAALEADKADGEESVVPAKKAKTEKDVTKDEKKGIEKQKSSKKDEDEDELDELENHEDEDGDEGKDGNDEDDDDEDDDDNDDEDDDEDDDDDDDNDDDDDDDDDDNEVGGVGDDDDDDEDDDENEDDDEEGADSDEE